MIWTTLVPKLTPFGTSGCNANHINARRQARREAGAERTLEAVRCSAMLGGICTGATSCRRARTKTTPKRSLSSITWLLDP